ncbi:MAG: EF-hand domain-containing protein, partial [Pirellulales bacterium]|nr:EF-hand domain-containing protein [Pirellulales bacterium]
GDRPRPDAPREGDRPRPDAPREGDRPRPDAPREGERGQPAELEGLFKRYDKNSDKTVVLEEFLALHQGNLTEQARRFWQEFFVSQDRNNDEKWDFEEFVGAVRAYNQR